MLNAVTEETSEDEKGGGDLPGAKAQAGPLKVMYTEWLAPRR